jgi:hypothetical protein
LKQKSLLSFHSGTTQHCCADLEDHWRVDTHLEDIFKCKEPHARVHFQRGGHAQDGFTGRPRAIPGDDLPKHPNGQWISLLQSSGPRVPFLPVCPIIAIDYVIGQHDGLIHARLRADPDYAGIVARAQSRLWNPFFEGLAASPANVKAWLGILHA